MKKIVKTIKKSKKNCFITMILLMIMVELLIRINSRVIQFLGICIVPFIIIVEIQLLLNDRKKTNN